MKYKWGAILGVWGSAAEGDVTHLNHCNKMRSQDVDSESSLFGRHSAGGCSVCLSQDDQRSSAWWISSSWAGTVRCPQNGLRASPAPPLRITPVISSRQTFHCSDVCHYESDYVVVDAEDPRRYLRSVNQWNVTVPHNEARSRPYGCIWLCHITSRLAFVCFICVFVWPGSLGGWRLR